MLENEIRGEVVHLATSRDGQRWKHPFPSQPFIPRGLRGEFDDMITFRRNPPVGPARERGFR